jgi:uncharacterized membrane protein
MFENSQQPEDQSGGIMVSSRMFGLLMLGVLLVFVGVIVLIAALVLGSGSGSVGGVIFIGPFPIVFGVGPDSGWLITISIIIAVVTVALFFVYLRRARR